MTNLSSEFKFYYLNYRPVNTEKDNCMRETLYRTETIEQIFVEI